jgi:rhodanese-related sulfurtransferase
LKERLDWGEPALTIIDVRDRDAFNISHICGAISLPLNELVVRHNDFDRLGLTRGHGDAETRR